MNPALAGLILAAAILTIILGGRWLDRPRRDRTNP